MNKKALLFVAINTISVGAVYAAGGYALEDVVVTAQKTEETIQSIPISIQALDTKALENNSINNFSDVKTLIPSLKFAPYPTADQNLLVTLRGIAPSALELTQDTPTAIHINGVYIARGNGLNMAVADLERIEVLRGPQGTLYGRNATAGAINMITAKPTDHFSFKQQFTLAEQDQVLTKTTVNVPITDNFYAKVSYLYDNKEGHVSNSAFDGIDFGDRNAQAARLDLRWQPTNDLIVDYGYDREQERYYSTPMQCLKYGNAPPPTANPTIHLAMDPSECSSSFKDQLGYYGHAPKSTLLVEGHTLAVEWELKPITLRSITGYRTLDDKYYGVLLGGGPGLVAGTIDIVTPNFSLLATPDRTKQHQFSQEFQLVGDIGEHLTYTTGLFYFKEDGSEKQNRSSQVLANVSAGADLFVDTGPRDLSGVTNESKAIFGQLTWTPPILDDNLDIIPGIRYTRDSRQASLYQHGPDVFPLTTSGGLGLIPVSSGTPIGSPDAPAQFDKKFSKTSPSLTVQYHVNPDVLTYAKYVKGYKSGGTAIRSTTAEHFIQGFGPETLTSIELGIKSSWFDQRLRVNADVFQSKFKDQQISVPKLHTAGAVPPVDEVNAGSSTYQGGELELQVAVTEDLRLSANYAYLHYKYDKVEDPLVLPGHDVDVTKFFHNTVPTNTYALSADYSVSSVDFAKLDFNLNYSYTDATGAYVDDYTVSAAGIATRDPLTAPAKNFLTPSFGLWNGRVSLSEIHMGVSDKSTLSVALWCKNIADKQYITFQTGLGLNDASAYQGFWGEPRTVGFDLVYKYE